MAIIRPFVCIRPRPDLAEDVAALPYDVYSSAEARREVAQRPYSFLRIDRAETNFSESVNIYSTAVYEKAKELLDEWMRNGTLLRDKEACFYLYELTMDGRVQTGIVGCVAVEDYIRGVVKKHETTRVEKELDRMLHVDICDAQTGPIFLAYRKNEGLKRITDEVRMEKPIYDFTADDGIRHRIFRISQRDRISRIAESFAPMESIYIADGHHRAAAAVLVAQRRHAAHREHMETQECQFFLSALFPVDELMILGYHRIVKDLNGLSADEFLHRLEGPFRIRPLTAYEKPERKGHFTMYLKGRWYRCEIQEESRSQDPVKGLDVSILQEKILAPLLGIADPSTSKRIAFVGGIRSEEEIEKRYASGETVAFVMYPTVIEDLMAVADTGMRMPPKSTWFEPKLRSGLFIHQIS